MIYWSIIFLLFWSAFHTTIELRVLRLSTVAPDPDPEITQEKILLYVVYCGYYRLSHSCCSGSWFGNNSRDNIITGTTVCLTRTAPVPDLEITRELILLYVVYYGYYRLPHSHFSARPLRSNTFGSAHVPSLTHWWCISHTSIILILFSINTTWYVALLFM